MPTVRDLAPSDAAELTALYEDYGWWEDREVPNVREALAETDVALGVFEVDDLVASARVLTDFTYYAKVYDVIVAAVRRGQGLGEMLMEAVIDHSHLQDVEGLALNCRRSIVPYYESVGFERYDPETEIPEGGTGELLRMVYSRGQ